MKGVQVQNDPAAAAASNTEAEYVLRLFISGASANSAKAVLNLKNICETYIQGRYELEVIDIYQQNELVQQEHITAVPSLIIHTARSAKRLVGNMSDCQKILQGLKLTT